MHSAANGAFSGFAGPSAGPSGPVLPASLNPLNDYAPPSAGPSGPTLPVSLIPLNDDTGGRLTVGGGRLTVGGYDGASADGHSTGDGTGDGDGGDDYYRGGSEFVATLPRARASLRRLSQRRKLTADSGRMMIALVGLPGRGKSFIGRKLQNYLQWRGARSKVFNVGRYRRGNAAGAPQGAEFFDAANTSACQAREAAAAAAMADAAHWLEETEGGGSGEWGSVAILDATNSTVARRRTICDFCRRREGFGVVFVESVCDDQDLLDENFRKKIAVSPDYKNVPYADALADLRSRVSKYEAAYETVDEDDLSYIKIFNLSSKILANNIYGRLSKTIIPGLMSWHIGTRPLWICRAGETGGHKGRDDRLGDKGEAFRDALGEFVAGRAREFTQNSRGMYESADCLVNLGAEDPDAGRREVATFGRRTGGATVVHGDGTTPRPPTFGRHRAVQCKIMTSTMARAIQTVSFGGLDHLHVEETSALNPIDKGDFSGLELDEIAVRDPEWHARLTRHPFTTRFPGGESYRDLIVRLESAVIEMEQQVVPVLVCTHLSVIQCLLGYFRNVPAEECTNIGAPLNTLVELVPTAGGGWVEEHLSLLDGDITGGPPTIERNASFEHSPKGEQPIWCD